MKWNKLYKYPNSTRQLIEGNRHYDVSNEILPSVTTILSATQSEEKAASLARWKSKVGENRPSPYTKKSIDNVLATTKDNLNEWVTVKANVKEDFKKFHDLDVNELDGLAIMADTDNSKMKSISYFQNIYFSSD